VVLRGLTAQPQQEPTKPGQALLHSLAAGKVAFASQSRKERLAFGFVTLLVFLSTTARTGFVSSHTNDAARLYLYASPHGQFPRQA